MADGGKLPERAVVEDNWLLYANGEIIRMWIVARENVDLVIGQNHVIGILWLKMERIQLIAFL